MTRLSSELERIEAEIDADEDGNDPVVIFVDSLPQLFRAVFSDTLEAAGISEGLANPAIDQTERTLVEAGARIKEMLGVD